MTKIMQCPIPLNYMKIERFSLCLILDIRHKFNSLNQYIIDFFI